MFKAWVNSHRYVEKTDPKLVFRVLNRWRHARAIDPASVETLVRLLEIDETHAYNILKGFRTTSLLTKNQLTRAISVCLEYGIDNEVIKKNPDLLRLNTNALEHRICFYKDLGCPLVTPSLIQRFPIGLQATPNDLKEQKLLPPDADVVENLLSCLDKPPFDVPPVERPSDDERLDTLHTTLLMHYLTWKLELTEDQANKMLHSKKFKNPSFSIVRELLDLFLNEVGWCKRKIRSNIFILKKTPRGVRQIMTEIPEIGNEDIKSIMIRSPRLLHQQADTIHEKLDVLKTGKVPHDAVSTIPMILQISSKTIASRLQEFKTMSELAGHWKNPRMLMMIYYWEGVKKNLTKLKELNIRFTSIHVLCAGNKAFQKYTDIGSERTKCKDTLRFLADELQKDKDVIRTYLKRHPLWCQIPFIYVQETYGFLKQNNFSSQDIFNNVHILLYRSAQVERYLQKMDLGRIDKPWELTDSRKLALCLYDIEKPYHFNGGGIWNCHYDGVFLTEYDKREMRRIREKRVI